MIRAIVFALIASAGVHGGDLAPDVLHLARVKARQQEAIGTMPDYTCLAVTERSQQGLRDSAPQPIDVIRMEVAHAGKADLYAWPGAARFETSQAMELIGAGMYGTGEFATHLRSIFGGYAVMKYAGEVNVAGRKLWRWDYKLAQVFSRWVVSFASRSATAGEIGSFWADERTLDVVRLEIHSDGLPPNFPISEVDTTIDYARVRIGERKVFLPQTAVTVMMEGFSGKRMRNLTEFSHCRQYVTQSEVRYDVGPPAPAGKAEAAGGVQEIAIPANLRIPVVLTAEVDSSASMVGDPIEAMVTADVRQRGRGIVVPKGAALHGRLRRMDFETGPPEHFLIGLEFMDLEFSGCHARFLGRLDRLDPQTSGLRWLIDSPVRVRKEKTGHGIDVITSGTAYRIPAIPGVGVFFMEGSSFRLPKGMAMSWVTEDIARK
jgi:hypothetical protein